MNILWILIPVSITTLLAVVVMVWAQFIGRPRAAALKAESLATRLTSLRSEVVRIQNLPELNGIEGEVNAITAEASAIRVFEWSKITGAVSSLHQTIGRQRAAVLAGVKKEAEAKKTARSAQNAKELKQRLDKWTTDITVAQDFDTIDWLEGVAQSATNEAIASGLADWQVVSEAFAALRKAIGKQRSLLVKNERNISEIKRAECIARRTSDLVAHLVALEKEIAATETHDALEAATGKVQALLSEASAAGVTDWTMIISANASIHHALGRRRALIEARESENAASARVAQQSEVLRTCMEQAMLVAGKLAEAGLHTESVMPLLGAWHQDPKNVESFGNYISAVVSASERCSVENATRLLLDAESNMQSFWQSARPESMERGLSLQTELQVSRQMLQERIQKHRRQAFSEVLTNLTRLAKRCPSAKTRSELLDIQKEGDGLLRNWGPANPEELVRWNQEYCQFMDKLLLRDREIAEGADNEIRVKVRNDAEFLMKQFTKAASDATNARQITDLESIEDPSEKCPQIDVNLLSDDDKQKINNKSRQYIKSMRDAEIRIMDKLRLSYNQNSVQKIDNLLKRFSIETNRKREKIPFLVGDFANLDTNLFEPAIVQYYQLAVAQVIGSLDQESCNQFMGLIAGSSKSGLEG